MHRHPSPPWPPSALVMAFLRSVGGGSGGGSCWLVVAGGEGASKLLLSPADGACFAVFCFSVLGCFCVFDSQIVHSSVIMRYILVVLLGFLVVLCPFWSKYQNISSKTVRKRKSCLLVCWPLVALCT